MLYERAPVPVGSAVLTDSAAAVQTSVEPTGGTLMDDGEGSLDGVAVPVPGAMVVTCCQARETAQVAGVPPQEQVVEII